jgi:hypothetical protein
MGFSWKKKRPQLPDGHKTAACNGKKGKGVCKCPKELREEHRKARKNLAKQSKAGKVEESGMIIGEPVVEAAYTSPQYAQMRGPYDVEQDIVWPSPEELGEGTQKSWKKRPLPDLIEGTENDEPKARSESKHGKDPFRPTQQEVKEAYRKSKRTVVLQEPPTATATAEPTKSTSLKDKSKHKKNIDPFRPTSEEVREVYIKAKETFPLHEEPPAAADKKKSPTAEKKEKSGKNKKKNPFRPTRQEVKTAYNDARKAFLYAQRQDDAVNPGGRNRLEHQPRDPLDRPWCRVRPEYIGCCCGKKNGLQDDCRRSLCQGRPECLTDPPTCLPSQGVWSLSHP